MIIFLVKEWGELRNNEHGDSQDMKPPMGLNIETGQCHVQLLSSHKHTGKFRTTARSCVSLRDRVSSNYGLNYRPATIKVCLASGSRSDVTLRVSMECAAKIRG